MATHHSTCTANPAPAPGTEFAAIGQARLDVLGDLVAGHLDTGALSVLISGGPPPGLPSVLTWLGPAQS